MEDMTGVTTNIEADDMYNGMESIPLFDITENLNSR